MKKTTILFIIMAFSIFANAQTEKISGSWLMTKVEMGDETQEVYSNTDFSEDGNIVISDVAVGTWEYKKKGNIISMESEMDKNFNGDWKIVTLNSKELKLNKDDVTLFYSRIDNEKIKEANLASGLIGVWRFTDIEGGTNLLKFESPNTFVLKTISGMSSSTAHGEWMYDPKDNSLMFTGFAYELRGKNNIVKMNAEELEFTHDEVAIKATKENIEANKIERLTYTYEDFPEDIYSDEIIPANWIDFNGMVSFLSGVEYLKYSNGTLIEGFNAYSYNTILLEIDANVEESNVMFTNLSIMEGDTMQYGQDYKGGMSEMYNYFFPQDEPNVFRLTGTETITVAAGTFECTVIEGVDDDNVKFWLINDKPGVYARIISEGEGSFGDLEYKLMELEDIK